MSTCSRSRNVPARAEWSASYLYQGTYLDASFEANGAPQSTRGWLDDVATDYAIEFLRSHRNEPFLLVVVYKAPHGPHEEGSVPERAHGRHRGVELVGASSTRSTPSASPSGRSWSSPAT